MINRIRDIRRQKQLTLADVALRCTPQTTAQTIGRLETGTRTLSLGWMNRIAAALDVAPDLLLRSEEVAPAQIVARLTASGIEALSRPQDALLPISLDSGGVLVVMTVETGAGEYRAGDQVWLRQASPENAVKLLNRDVLAPRPGGRYAFGRMIDRDDARVALLPPGPGARQVVIEQPEWLAAAEMLVRTL